MERRDLKTGIWYSVRYVSEDFVHDYGFWLFHERVIAFAIFEHPHNGAYLYVADDDWHWRIEKKA